MPQGVAEISMEILAGAHIRHSYILFLQAIKEIPIFKR